MRITTLAKKKNKYRRVYFGKENLTDYELHK